MAAAPDTYHVFRRFPDGYVGAIAGDMHSLSGAQSHGTIGGQPVTFEVLLSTQDWPQARDLIARERAAGTLGKTDEIGA